MTLNKNENVVCTFCLHQLPLTDFHTYNENTVKKVFYGRIPLINATSLFYFYKKGITQSLLHQLKYKGKEEVSGFLGKWLGEKLIHYSWSRKIDSIVPVPLHKKRFKERGYNQVEGFGKALAKKLNCAYVDDVLIKKSASMTQVFKGRFDRSAIKEDFFNIQNAQKLKDKHILLVDDIITTGATMEACASKLLQIEGTQISLASMAVTV